jgi:hypothetical protein
VIIFICRYLSSLWEMYASEHGSWAIPYHHFAHYFCKFWCSHALDSIAYFYLSHLIGLCCLFYFSRLLLQIIEVVKNFTIHKLTHEAHHFLGNEEGNKQQLGMWSVIKHKFDNWRPTTAKNKMCVSFKRICWKKTVTIVDCH